MSKIKYILGLLSLALLMFSCDVIPENEILLDVETPPAQRVVLLEDYTGQKCVNCPLAAKEIELLTQTFGKNLIPVSIHAGYFSIPAMRTPAGDAYVDHYKIETFPKGLVNRQKYNGEVQLDYNYWGQAIQSIIWEKQEIAIEMERGYNAADSLLNLRVELNKTTAFQYEKVNLQLWILENGIVDFQRMPDGSYVDDYVHNHVLRDAPNEIWGTEVTFNNNSYAFELENYSFKGKLWKPENCEIVAFVYNTDTKEIIEAAKIELKD